MKNVKHMNADTFYTVLKQMEINDKIDFYIYNNGERRYFAKKIKMQECDDPFILINCYGFGNDVYVIPDDVQTYDYVCNYFEYIKEIDSTNDCIFVEVETV